MQAERARARPASLAFRVMALIGVAVLACFLVLGWIVQRSIEHHFAEQDADELRVVAEAVRQALFPPRPAERESEVRERLEGAVSGHHGVYFGVFRKSGEMLHTTGGPDLPAVAAELPLVTEIRAENLYQWSEAEHVYRGALVSMGGETGMGSELYLLTASAMDFHLEFMQSFKKALWSIMAVASAVMLFAAWFAVQFGHRPLHRVSEKIRGISSDKLHTRLETTAVPKELLELVVAFNEMMGRMEDVFSRLSNFSADIAHELRTPITNLTTQTQVALSKARAVEEYREVLYSNLEEYDRLAKMVADMLWLAKTDNGLLKPDFADLDPGEETKELFGFYEAWAEECGVSLKLEGSAPGIRGDREMFRRALGNLLSNAIRHTYAGSTVTVRLAREKGKVRVSVENPGETIAAEHLPRIFDRFYCTDPSRQRQGEGAGLGLAIVKAIVGIHDGSVSVSSSGGITSFTVLLPAAGEAVTAADGRSTL